ncbi:MAG: hypothetical protein QF893_24110, partial [Alphaproteobacteria bacterium]|nr:hypothetical protein [Alphaproteobacteria bacterium]
EAADAPGGQLRLAIRNPRRREMGAVIDWRMAQCASHGVVFRFNTLAEPADVSGEDPDVVIVATGGMPGPARLEGGELTVSSWDILTGDVAPGETVLLWDDAGDPTGLQAAEVIAAAGSRLEIMNRERSIASEVMGMNLTPIWARCSRSASSSRRRISSKGSAETATH